MKKRIAILFHELDRKRDLICYAITFLAEYWRADGHEVIQVFGCKKFIPADLALLDVDRSVVPDEYLAFAQRYPIALNGRVRDVRKTTISTNLVNRSDSYGGQVILKSNLNYAGLPEREMDRLSGSRLARRIRRLLSIRSPYFSTPVNYRIFERAGDVPRACFKRRDLVVERFLPEIERGLYHIRNYQFLGDRETWTRLASRYPIVNDITQISQKNIEPDSEIAGLRHTLGFDYGKLDYVIHNGKTVLLDANKTTGASGVRTPELEAMRRHHAGGIYSYFA
jgi:hypothetical protein